MARGKLSRIFSRDFFDTAGVIARRRALRTDASVGTGRFGRILLATGLRFEGRVFLLGVSRSQPLWRKRRNSNRATCQKIWGAPSFEKVKDFIDRVRGRTKSARSALDRVRLFEFDLANGRRELRRTTSKPDIFEPEGALDDFRLVTGLRFNVVFRLRAVLAWAL